MADYSLKKSGKGNRPGKDGNKIPNAKRAGSKKRKFLSFFAVMNNLLCIGLAIYVFRPLKGTDRKVGTNVTLMSNVQPNSRPDPGRRAKEISQSKQLHTLCVSVSDTPIYVHMLSKHHAYIRIFQECHRNMYNLENAAAHADIVVRFRSLGESSLSCFDGKGGDAEVGSSWHIDGRTKNCRSINFPPQGHLDGISSCVVRQKRKLRVTFWSHQRKRFRYRQLADNGVVTDDTGCNSVQYEDMTKLDSVGSGEIVTYDYVIEFFQKGEKIVECDGLGAGDAEVEGITKEENIIKVDIVDFLAKLQINGVSHKPVNVHMENSKVGENKDNAQLTDDNKESQTLVMDDLRNVSNLEDSETQLSHEAIQQLQTEATDDRIVDDDAECQNVVMDNDVLSAKDEAESAREVKQQLETDDLIVGDVSEALIEDSESVDLDAKNMNDNVEKIDDYKESQTVVMDDVLNVRIQKTITQNQLNLNVVMDHVQNPLSSEDDEVKSVSELEKKLKTEANNDLLVNSQGSSAFLLNILGENLSKNLNTRVIGCPKTIDGDLKFKEVPTSFGFDAAFK
ncbi:pyrophosphate--fructose 6-phosphate 1-phosphotransferase subunit beta 1-like protein isoform X5 [Tanacetum coccineum]